MKNTSNKQTYSVADISEYLGISSVGANNLFHSKEFPSFRVGKRLLVTRDAFEKWLQEQQKKEA